MREICTSGSIKDEAARREAARLRRAHVEQRAAARERPADQQAHARRPARQR